MKQAFRPTRANRQQGQPGQQAQSGFSLIELMVVIVIIGIIAAFAIPNYQQSVRRAERTDARAMLLHLQSLQERYYFNQNQYGDLEDITGTASGSTYYSPDRHYEGTITLANTNQTYTLTATRADTSLDTDCKEFSLTNTGTKSAKDSGDNDATADCWGR